MRELIDSKEKGSRNICGASWPVTDLIERELLKNSKNPTWVVTIGLCNGVPDDGKEFKSKKDALAFFHSLK